MVDLLCAISGIRAPSNGGTPARDRRIPRAGFGAITSRVIAARPAASHRMEQDAIVLRTTLSAAGLHRSLRGSRSCWRPARSLRASGSLAALVLAAVGAGLCSTPRASSGPARATAHSRRRSVGCGRPGLRLGGRQLSRWSSSESLIQSRDRPGARSSRLPSLVFTVLQFVGRTADSAPGVTQVSRSRLKPGLTEVFRGAGCNGPRARRGASAGSNPAAAGWIRRTRSRCSQTTRTILYATSSGTSAWKPATSPSRLSAPAGRRSSTHRRARSPASSPERSSATMRFSENASGRADAAC